MNPCAVALFGKESSVTRDPERLAAYQWVDADHLHVARERTRCTVSKIGTARCGNCEPGVTRSEIGKRKRSNGPFPTVENSNDETYIVSENIYCSGKHMFSPRSIWPSI